MKKICSFTSGGDSPGMNACVRQSFRTAISKAWKFLWLFTVVMRGNDRGGYQKNALFGSVIIIQRGGTILKSARSEGIFELRRQERKASWDSEWNCGFEGIVAIGGHGNLLSGAKIFFREYGYSNGRWSRHNQITTCMNWLTLFALLCCINSFLKANW